MPDENKIEFAGLTWPRKIARFLPWAQQKYNVPPCILHQREAKDVSHKARQKYKLCMAYHSNRPHMSGKTGGVSFYLESDFQPGLRWQWCDEISTTIRHTGWFTDEYGDGEKIRGLVMRLPHGRGFLAGWSMGKGMASEIENHIYPDEIEAAYAADRLAERVADAQREQEQEELV